MGRGPTWRRGPGWRRDPPNPDETLSAFVARLYDRASELMAPPRPTGGIAAEQDRVRRRAVAAALAPWKRAIAAARGMKRSSCFTRG